MKAPARTRGLSIASTTPAWWNSRWLVAAAALLAALPLLWPAVPPLVDLPGHMGRYRVMLGDEHRLLDRWYQFHWRLVGNLGVDLLVRALAPAFGLEPSVKAVVIAIPVLTVAGMLWLACEVHGRVEPFALFALPLAYNFTLQFGFVNYALAVALAFNAFAGWIALGRRDRVGLRAGLFVPVSLVIWLCHMVGWGMLGLMVGAYELARDRTGGRTWPGAVAAAAARCVPLAAPVPLMLWWRSGGVGGLTTGWLRWDLKLSWLSMILRDRWAWLDIGTTALLFLILYRAARDPRLRFDRSLATSALALFAAMMVLPVELFGSVYADMRLAPYVVALALLSLRPGTMVSARERALLALAGAALFLTRIGAATASYALYAETYTRQLAALDHVPQGARLLTLVGAPCPETWAQSRLEHLSGLAIARRAAFSNDQWELAGAPLLVVRARGIATFSNDPSQIVSADLCPTDPKRRAIGEVLGAFPRDRFSYLWLIRPPIATPPRLTGMTRIWSGDGSALYRIAGPRR